MKQLSSRPGALKLVVAVAACLSAQAVFEADAVAQKRAPRMPRLVDVVVLRDVTATSVYKDRTSKDLYEPWRTLIYDALPDVDLHDLVPRTAWCEGKRDQGIGEGITIQLDAPTQLDEIRIAAGVWKTQKLFAANNRIDAVSVTFDDAKPVVAKATKKREWLVVPVGRQVTTIGIKIAKVTKGRMNDSCISAVQLVRDDEVLSPVRGLDRAAVDALPKALAAIETALADKGRRGLDRLIAFPFELHDATDHYTGNSPKVTHASWKALASACRAWDVARARSEDAETDEPRRCPTPLALDPDEDRLATVKQARPGEVAIVFEGPIEVAEVWRLRWVTGRWLLTAIGFQTMAGP